MRVSSRADYGVRALVDLAGRAGRGPTQSREIAARQGIPESYLHQLLGALNRAGLVKSTRGPQGGHELAGEPEAISVWDAMVALDGPDQADHPHPCPDGERDVVHETWHELRTRSVEYLASITLSDLVERQRSGARTADYSI